jgi:four helix bundle protein
MGKTEDVRRKTRPEAAAFRLAHYDLLVWQEAMRLVRMCYESTQDMPSGERFGLTSQIRRAAVSVPSNIAEGAARGSIPEFRRFLLIARASLAELDTLLWLAKDLGMVPRLAPIRAQLETVFAKLNGLIASPGKRDRLVSPPHTGKSS